MQARFGAFTVDDRTREVRRDGQSVHVSPKAFDLLALLLRRRPEALSKADLHQALWPETFVSDGSLAVLVTELRRVLDDSARNPTFIRTVNRFGYAFVGSVAESSTGDPGASGAPACWLTWGDERVQLKAGQNVIGRDPEADVHVGGFGVSRRHAAIDVSRDGATLKDLASKNGTFIDETRVAAPMRLHDNADIRLGALRLRFRRSDETTTATVTDGEKLQRS